MRSSARNVYETLASDEQQESRATLLLLAASEQRWAPTGVAAPNYLP
jgi:hypothetical protein